MKNNPTFKAIFAEQWQHLPIVLKQRYANRPYCSDEVVVDGILDVHISTWMKILSPFLRLCGALVPYAGKNIPVTVRFNSNKKSDAVGFNRTFNFKNRKAYQFQSKLVPAGNNRVIEFMRFGLGWLMHYRFDGEKVHLEHQGYLWKIGKLSIPLPFRFILGKGYAYEQALDDEHFQMYFEIIHPLFGKIFGYGGKFKLTEVKQ